MIKHTIKTAFVTILIMLPAASEAVAYIRGP